MVKTAYFAAKSQLTYFSQSVTGQLGFFPRKKLLVQVPTLKKTYKLDQWRGLYENLKNQCFDEQSNSIYKGKYAQRSENRIYWRQSQ